MKYDITASLVTYNNDITMLKKTIASFLNTNLNVKLSIIDNSPSDNLKILKNINTQKIEYTHNPTNPGFGTAHNIAIKENLNNTLYHLILNPDIYFEENVNEEIITFLEKNIEVGVLMPKIVYPDNSTQFVAKLLPTPFTFFVRRLIPIKSILEKVNHKFELRFTGYNKIMEVPYLSGCYLVIKTEALKKAGLFDENYFMHCEDIDICRTIINSGYKSVFYPKVKVVHAHEKKSMKSINNLKVYIKSMIYYFNKWGWFFDSKRKEINKNTLKQF
ncbi:MAG: glycosyl transferase family 2 [Lutibacter sp.]|nr:MAG: glycosyl transferase family 2 [Lutibacter sp.]